MDTYDRMLVPFPFKEMNIIQVNDLGFGIAPPGAVLITNEAFATAGTSYDALMRQIYSNGINQRLAHELAHQYWGQMVKNPSPEEHWLTESFAQYCSALALLSLNGYGKPASSALFNDWRFHSNLTKDAGTIPFADRIHSMGDPQGSFLLRTHLLYSRGPLLLEKIHEEVGTSDFLKALRSMILSADWGCLTTQDFSNLLGLITKKDWDPFFKKYYWGEEVPVGTVPWK